MSDQFHSRLDPRLEERLPVFAGSAAAFSVTAGLSVLTGWTLHIASLLTWGYGVTMAPNAAACSVLAGISLWLQRKRVDEASGWGRKVSAKAAAGIVGLVGLFSLGEHLFRSDLGIDRLLVASQVAETATARIRMSPVAAGAFLLFGLALLVMDWRTQRQDWPAQFLAFGAAIGPAFGLFGLILGPSESPITLALPTVVIGFVLVAGLLCSRAGWALGGLLVGQNSGARLLRRTIPGAVLVFSLIGFLISKPLLSEGHFTWVEVSLLAVFSGALLAGFIAWMAFIVERSDAERNKVEEVSHVSQEELNQLLGRIEEPQAEAQLRTKVKVGFAFAIILSTVLGFLSWRMAQQAGDDANWVVHTHEVSTTLEAALRHLVDVESGERGFVLTGSEPFLAPYETGKSAIVEDLHRLKLLVADNLEQERRLVTLEAQAKGTIEAASDLAMERRKTGKIPTREQLERGKQLMDAARITVDEMEDAEMGLLARRAQRARVTQRFNISVIVLGSLVGVIFLTVAGATVSREIGISARAHTQINNLNTELERRVAQRTEALGESEGRLAGVIQSATDAIISVDEEQQIVLFNGAAERIFRCPTAEALGQPITRFIPQRFHGAHGSHIRKFGETGVSNRAMGPKGVLWAVRADGQEFQIEASISQVVTGGKKLFTVILRDVTERVQATEARERLAAIVDSSDDAIISKTLDGTITAWNHGAEKIFGYSAAEAVGQPMSMLMPPERADDEADILGRARRGLSVEHFETIRVRKDGKKIDVSVTISPIRDSNGVVIGASKVARDISERKLAEEAIRESEERFHAMLNGIPQLAWMAESDGSIFWFNQRWYDYTGTTLEQTKGWTWDSVHDPEILPKVLERWKSSIATGEPFDMEFPLRGADGSFRPFLTRVMAVRDSEGRVVRWFGTNTDISERKRVEERLETQAQELVHRAQELARSREDLEAQTRMLKLVLESIGEGLIAADRAGHFLIWNDSARKLLGRGPADVNTEEWTSHYGCYEEDGITPVPTDDLPLVRAMRGESLQTQLIVRHPGNESGIFLEFVGRPMKDDEGNFCGGVVAFRDITQRKTDEGEIRKLNDELEIRVLQRTAQLEIANKELESFSYSVSHDLRAPLRHINGFSKILMEEFGSTLDPSAQHYLDRIQSGTQKMGLLIDELLNLAKVGRHALNVHAAELNPVIAEVIAILEPDAAGREVQWVIADLPMVECDLVLVKQIFQNLLANALKFTRARAQALIQVSHEENGEDGQSVFMVRDNGIGFNMKYVDKLFGVFQRLHRPEDFEGTGIGLATVQRIVQKHGGRVWAEGEVEKGAAFYFTLCAAKQVESKSNRAAGGGQS